MNAHKDALKKPKHCSRQRTGYIYIFSGLLLISICINAILYAQQNYNAAGALQVEMLLNKAQHFTDAGNFDSAMRICSVALSFAQESGYATGKAQAYIKMADIAYHQTNIAAMGHYDSLALQISKSLNNTTITASSLNLLGLYFAEQGKKTDAESVFFNALKIQDSNESTLAADIFNNLGYMYGLQGEPEKAADWHIKSLRVYEKLSDENGQAKTLDNIAALYYSLGKFDEAISFQKKCIGIRRHTSDHYGLAIAYSNISQMYLAIDSANEAFSYQQLGMQNAQSSGSKKVIAQSHIALSLLYSKKGENKKAMEEELKAISLLEEIGEKGMLSRRYIAAGIGYSQQDSVTAVDYFNKSIALSNELHNRENLRDVYAYENIFYRERKDFFNAYYNYRKYISYRDSIINEATLTSIAELQTKYETEKKDGQIKHLTDEQLIQQLQLEKQKAIITGNLLTAREKENEIDLLIKSRALQNLEIKKQEQDLQTQTILAEITEQKRKLAQQDTELKEKQLQKEKLLRNIIIGSFFLAGVIVFGLFNRYQLKKKLEQQAVMLKERSRISSELHDEVGSTLSAINILSHGAKNNLQKNIDKSGAMISKIGESSQRMMLAMKDIVWSINPGNDSMESVIVRMKEYAAEILEAKNVEYFFTINIEVSALLLAEDLRRNIYLVFKEAVNNLAKYAEASAVKIDLLLEKNMIHLIIKDDGKGFDVTKNTSSNGVKNMQMRASAHKGSVIIISNANKGTCIHASFSIA
jgi:signal transduction histidine kinase/Flp pilus assembly protein TadD